MVRLFFQQVCRHSPGRAVVAGAIGVLSGIEHFLAPRKQTAPRHANSKPVAFVKPAAAAPVVRPPKPRTRCFEIRRTKSELGYTYWVLRGFGRFRCFELYDSWSEAMSEAANRLGAEASHNRSVLTAAAV